MRMSRIGLLGGGVGINGLFFPTAHGLLELENYHVHISAHTIPTYPRPSPQPLPAQL